jgi:hypothetical protein
MNLILKSLLVVVLVALGGMVLAQPSAPISAQTICYGVYYANASQLRCTQLIGPRQEICKGVKAANERRASCGSMAPGLAKTLCVGTAAATLQNSQCASLTDADEKSVCTGTVRAISNDDEETPSTKSCDQLSGLAKNVCWGVYHAIVSGSACEDLN